MSGTAAMTTISVIALAVGLGADADEASVTEAVKTLNKRATDAEKQRDQLVAAVKADSFDDALGTATAVIAEREAAAQRERDEVLSRIKAAGKSTPELEEVVFPSLSVTALVAFERSATTDKRNEIITRIRAAGKCTPAQEKTLFPAMDVAALEAFEKSAPPVIGDKGIKPPKQSGTTGDLSWNGKRWQELSHMEKHALHEEDPNLFSAMRKAAGAR